MRFLFLNRSALNDDLSGAFSDAGQASRTLLVVDDGKIIDHRNGAARTVLCAKSATDATLRAGVHDVLTLAVGGAGDVYGRRNGNAS